MTNKSNVQSSWEKKGSNGETKTIGITYLECWKGITYITNIKEVMVTGPK